MVGKGIADAVSKFTSSRLYYTSHQVGHILAALYSVGRLDLVTEDNDGEFSYPARFDALCDLFYRDCHRLGVTRLTEGANVPWVEAQ